MTNNERTNRRGADLDALADKTSGAYSWDRYGEKNWKACVRMLSRRGYDDREIEAILLSKWTRWAGDAAGKDSRVNSADLARFIDSQKDVAAQVAELVAGTF